MRQMFYMPALVVAMCWGASLCGCTKSEFSGEKESFVPRIVPPPFAAARLPVYPIDVRGAGVGTVKVNIGPPDLAYLMYRDEMNGSMAYVDCTLGDDSASGSREAPLRTIAHAMRDLQPTTVVVFPGVCEPFEYRTTDVGHGALKRLIAPYGRVTIRVSGPELGAQTWVPLEGHPELYRAILALGRAQVPERLLTAMDHDSWGFERRLRRYESLEELTAAGTGWYFDNTSGALYLGYAGLPLPSYRAYFRALYLDRAGNAQALIYGAHLLIDGDFYFDGVAVWGLAYERTVPSVFLRGITVAFARPNNVFQQGGLMYSEHVRSHGAWADNFNCRPVSGETSSLCIEHDNFSTGAGDLETYGTGIETNRNAHSAEPGANDAIFGGIYEGSWGPDIANVSDSEFPANATWIVGAVVRRNAQPNGSIGIVIQGLHGTSRRAWIDSVVVDQEDHPIVSDLTAVVKTFDNRPSKQPEMARGGIVGSYTPIAP